MEKEKCTAKKLVLNKKTIAKLNENQMIAIKGGNGFFNLASDDIADPGGCTSFPLTRPIPHEELTA
jgi:hypothetical protein